jgi:hypothetical protein
MTDSRTAKPDLEAIRSQHIARMRENALRIQEFTGYILTRIDAGHPETVELTAAEIVSAGQRIMTDCATIQGLDILGEDGRQA